MVAECPGLPHDGAVNFTLTLTGNATGPVKAYRETHFKGKKGATVGRGRPFVHTGFLVPDTLIVGIAGNRGE